ncbi:Agouti-related protein [Merluccius polli]|uniref:Agouti-related protein n=1 Tax=Merluccius polli TaxID=89951 RepID=A0AA47NNV9_MERPO|nr:Agouti-related protein [Merluccius polli]
MWTIKAKYLLFICLLFSPLSWAEDLKKNASKKEMNDADWSHGKQRRLFARRRIPVGQGGHVPKLKAESVMPVRRCSRLMENCSTYIPCCDPCASCRCRLFNTICHCWKMSLQCIRKT